MRKLAILVAAFASLLFMAACFGDGEGATATSAHSNTTAGPSFSYPTSPAPAQVGLTSVDVDQFGQSTYTTSYADGSTVTMDDTGGGEFTDSHGRTFPVFNGGSPAAAAAAAGDSGGGPDPEPADPKNVTEGIVGNFIPAAPVIKVK